MLASFFFFWFVVVCVFFFKFWFGLKLFQFQNCSTWPPCLPLTPTNHPISPVHTFLGITRKPFQKQLLRIPRARQLQEEPSLFRDNLFDSRPRSCPTRS